MLKYASRVRTRDRTGAGARDVAMLMGDCDREEFGGLDGGASLTML